MNKSHPIVDSKLWKPCGGWSENLTNNTKYLNKDNPWKSGFNPFANKVPTYEFYFSSDYTFDYIDGEDPWGRPLVKSIFYYAHKTKKPMRTALWRVECADGVPDYLETAYNQSKVYKKFNLIGFTSVNKEVIRLYIRNVTSDSLDKLKFDKRSSFLEWRPANFIDRDVDDDRPVPMWII
jgi:hypothetical protein